MPNDIRHRLRSSPVINDLGLRLYFLTLGRSDYHILDIGIHKRKIWCRPKRFYKALKNKSYENHIRDLNLFIAGNMEIMWSTHWSMSNSSQVWQQRLQLNVSAEQRGKNKKSQFYIPIWIRSKEIFTRISTRTRSICSGTLSQQELLTVISWRSS